jgi:hypothetical protein
LTPVAIGHPNIHRQKQLSSNDADDEKSETLEERLLSNNAGDENLEESIRSALSTPATFRKVDNSVNIKSVRWDPAIVSYGPITPNPSPSSKVESSKSTQSPREPASSSSKRRDVPKDLVMESLARLKKRDKDTLRRLLEELKDTESEGETTTESYPEQGDIRSAPYSNSVQLNPEAPAHRRFATLKAQIAQQFSEQRDSISAPHFHSAQLNPEAPAHRRYATLKAQIAQQTTQANLGKATLTLPRKRPHIGAGNFSPQRNAREPTWINIFNPPPHVALPHDAPAIPRPAPNVLHQDSIQPPPGFPPRLRLPLNPSADCWTEGIPGNQNPLPNGLPKKIPFAPPIQPLEPPQPIWLSMPIPPPCGLNNLPQFGYWVNPFGFQTPQPAPQPPPQPAVSHTVQPAARGSPSTISRHPFKPKGGRGPMVDVGPEFLPSEEEPGRVARAIESGWAKSLLAKFKEKYPQTGTVKAGPLAPGKMRQAAAIQQRLEFILYHQKERSAGQHSSDESQPPCYEVATGEKFAFANDERVASGEKNLSAKDKNVTYDGITREQMITSMLEKEREALVHYKGKVAITAEESPARKQSPANILDDLSDSFSKMGLDDHFVMVGC